MSHLFAPLTLRGVTLRNRIGVSPMCQYSSVDGLADDWHLVHLGSFATGGAGLIIAEATAVEARGRITPGCAGLWSDKHIEPLARINHFVKKHGAVPGIQLAHSGRKASADIPWKSNDRHLGQEEGGWDIIGASPLAFGGGLNRIPHEMTVTDIASVQKSFVDATKRAITAGYELVEFHGAHGYLAHSFYSPLSNQRTDNYGGSFENRIRFTVETVRTMRAVWPEKLPFIVRISATDWMPGGWTGEDSISLARHLKAEGVDMIDVSTGGNVPKTSIPVGPGFQVPFAQSIRKETGVATAAVGMITEPAQADSIIRQGQADLVLLAREFLREPHWPNRAAKALGYKQPVMPVQYARV